MKSEGEEYEQSGSGKVMGQAEMTEREEDEKERQDVGSWWFQMAIERKAIQGWRPADWGKEWTQLLKVLDNPFNICQPEKRPKPFRETIPKEEDNSNSKGAKIVDDKPARFDVDNNGGNQNVRDLITVEDNEEDFVTVESKRYESEGSSSEETIGEVSEEEGGEERGNEGLVEGKLEEGNDGMNVVGFEKDREVVGDWSIYVTPLLMGKDKYELIKRGGWKETMPSWDESGRLEASPLGQVWAGLLMGKNKFESIRLKLTLESYLISVTEKLLKMALNKIIDREVLILVGQEPKKVLVLETFNKWRESSQVRDV
ncbi:hypothetical protein PPACK8108_LOCUS12689 [Phakopsora pachyrhizi]|uniref:Uncharacterized protein n=1 Tax=Phakopsora pachyrhizi TaxID=170000 RepID=A0AAV0B226_PHAPC|nr:hypothetical protein PPACK8108_LOCUS12689 [Phakopsora pachyrhizi]